jgi:hypothetical protein
MKQTVSVHTLMELPIQKDTHGQHVAERVRRALAKEFFEELGPEADEQIVGSVHTVRPEGLSDADYLQKTTLRPHTARNYLHMLAGSQSILHAVVEYIQEAEHQDGDAYWNHFHTFEELEDDFDLYFENRGPWHSEEEE